MNASLKIAAFMALLVSSTWAQPSGAPSVAPTPPTPPTASRPSTSPSTTPSSRPATSPSTTPTSRAPASGPVPNAASLTPGSGSTPTDADILTFAYNLEVLEANFYSCLSSGQGVPSQYLGGGPAPIGCTKGNLSSNVATYFAELAREETAHVALLYSALTAAGASPRAPLTNISAGVFNTAATLAAGTTLDPIFDPAANDQFAIHSAFLFEDAGVSAYLGALNSISNSSYRLVGAQIGAAEAYHAALIRTLLYQVLNVVPAYNLTVQQITTAIVSLENTVAGQPQLKYNIYNDQGSAISNVDSNGLVPAASAQQILRIVTLGAPAGSGGGFFPQNLVGNVKN